MLVYGWIRIRTNNYGSRTLEAHLYTDLTDPDMEHCSNLFRYLMRTKGLFFVGCAGSSQHEDTADAPAPHCEDDLQRVHVLQHPGAGRLTPCQDNQSGQLQPERATRAQLFLKSHFRFENKLKMFCSENEHFLLVSR